MSHPQPHKSVHSLTAEPVLTEHNQSSLSSCTGLTRRHIIELGYWAHTKLRCFDCGKRRFCAERVFLPEKQCVQNYCHIATDPVDPLCFFPVFSTNISAIALRLPLPSKSADWTHFGGKQHCLSAHTVLVENQFFQTTEKQ